MFVLNIKINLINVIILKNKDIKCYFLFERFAYLNYKNYYIVFANNVKQQYLLKSNILKTINLRKIKEFVHL